MSYRNDIITQQHLVEKGPMNEKVNEQMKKNFSRNTALER